MTQEDGRSNSGRTYFDAERAVLLHDANAAVITAAKAMRNQLPGSVRMLYDAVDALVELEKKGNEL